MDAIAEFFRPGGALSRAHPGFEDRTGQREMAQTVAEVLEHGGSRLIEAGTGTGKTLAYLVPAILSGRRVIVSTGTRNLQDQIHAKDLPFLRERAGLDFSATVLKGRDNYLCRFRLAQKEVEPLFEELGEAPWLTKIGEWSRRTDTGDRAEIPDLPDNLRLWREINARSETCLGARCPEYAPCWLTRVKEAAEHSQIVIVNHHLFFADLALRTAYGAVLPDYDTVIFDEAHQIEETATLFFGLRVSSSEIEDLAREAERAAMRNDRQAHGTVALRAAADGLFGELGRLVTLDGGRRRLDSVCRGGPDLSVWQASLSEALDELGREARALGEEGEAITRRADELGRTLDRTLARDEADRVYGIERRGRRNIVISASPIDVSRILRENLFDGLHAAVLTSATLTVDGSFSFFADRLGLGEAEARIVPSPFDHANQAVLYLPRDMPEPREPGFTERAAAEISGLLEITDGRAFLLFTSHAQLRRIQEILTRAGRWPIFVQGEGSKVSLVEEFRRTPRAVLLGTTSFWHGVDVPGEALSLVVIDKLPFDVPSDPLLAARIERMRSEGRDPFSEYQLPLAVLDLKQGLGRLLRTRGDRGILAVLDPRIVTRRYGATFLRSLPPYHRSTDLDDCSIFFSGGGLK